MIFNPASLRRWALLAALALLAGCGAGADSPFAYIFGALTQNLGGSRAEAEARLDAQLTPAAIARATRELMLAELPSRGARATFVIGGRNRDHVTWIGADGTGIILKNGFLIGTRGLGHDLYAAEVAAAEAAVRRGAGTAQRSHRYLDGLHRVQRADFNCSYVSEGQPTIDIYGTARATRVVAEHCAGDGASFENRYWIGADGFVWRSVQWIGPELGAVTLTQLAR